MFSHNVFAFNDPAPTVPTFRNQMRQARTKDGWMKSLEWLTEERSGAVKRNVAGCRHRNDNVSGWSAGKWESHRWQLAEKKRKRHQTL